MAQERHAVVGDHTAGIRCVARQISASFLALGLLGLPAYAAPRVSLGTPGRIENLSGPREGDAFAIALDFVTAKRAELGLDAEDLAGLLVSHQSTSKHNGVTHIHLRQRWAGLEVHGADLSVSVARDGSIINLTSSFVPHLASLVATTVPSLSPFEALEFAADHLALGLRDPVALRSLVGGPAQEVLLSDGGIALQDIPARLMLVPFGDGEVRLAWHLEIYALDANNYWNLRVDASNGTVLDVDDWVDWDRYRVYASPAESPNHVTPLPPGDGRSLVVDPQDALASSLGWHNTGANQYTHTRGNNVDAYEDSDSNNAPTGGDLARASGGALRVFDYPINFAMQPATYDNAAITNLFYENNIIHDVLWHYGFDEASGNFQVNNFGNGGLGNDDVRAEAQDGGGTNNANFSTPVDGSRPRMQMFLWSPAPVDLVNINTPAVIAGGYLAIPAQFGGTVPPLPGLTANLILANDGTANPSQACNALTNGPAINGRFALIDRGNCPFVMKVKNAQNAGAIGVVVANNVGGGAIAMGGTDPTIIIPAVMVSLADGQLFRGQMPAPGVNMTLGDPGMGPMLDGDLDNGIIIHEFGHGVSNRLVGGPNNVSCLGNEEQAGEGWSDILALMLTAEPGDQGTDVRGIGTYAIGQAPTGGGIRTFPYSTDMNVNLHTYDDIITEAVPHGVGSVWAQMCWEMFWALVDRYGYDPDLYRGTGGNNIAIQLIIDGLKLDPCNPGFVDSRDAILQADQQNNGGVNFCLIWQAFAKRGLGFSASQGSSASRSDGSEAFDLPPQCAGMLPLVTVDSCTDSDLCLLNGNMNGIVEPGERITYQVVFSNTGAGAANDFRATINVTGGTIVSGGTVGGGPTVMIGPGASYVHNVDIDVTGSCSSTLEVDVVNMRDGATNFPPELALCDRAIGGGTCTACTPQNGLSIDTCDHTDLCSDSGISNGEVEPGEMVTYEVVIRNSGTVTANNVLATVTAITGATIVTGGTIGGSPPINIVAGGTYLHMVEVLVTGACGDTLDLDVINLRDAAATYGDETALCDRPIGAAACTLCCALPPDQGNVLLAVKNLIDVDFEYGSAPATEWRFNRDTDKRQIGMTDLSPDAMGTTYTDPGAVPASAGDRLYYYLRGLSCSGNPGP